METLYNGFILQLSAGSFPLSTDSMVLAHFATCKPNSKVLDLGSGCGTLGLLLCANNETCQVTGIEIDPNAHQQSLYNAENNGITHRLTSICSDISDIRCVVPAGSFSVCISNPPYFVAGPKSERTPAARREDLCRLDDLFNAADWALKYGGDFYLVHRPERLSEIFCTLTAHGLEPKRLRMVQYRQGSAPNLVLIESRRGGKPGLSIEAPLLLTNDEGGDSNEVKQIYHRN